MTIRVMMDLREAMVFPRLLFLFVAGFAYWQYAHYDALLPDVVATHFDGSGVANGWQSRAGFWQFYGIFLFCIWFIFFLIGWSLKFMPSSLINVPNRDYWLTNERRESCLARVRFALDWYGAATALWILWMMQSLIQLNLSESTQLGSMFLMQIVLMIVGTCIWVVWLLSMFRLPNSER